MTVLLTPGSVLAASPDMLDPNFMHSVVQLCDHDENGAFGLLLNRTTGLTVQQLAADHPDLGGLNLPVADGGPVGRDQLQFLHRIPQVVRNGIQVMEGLHLGGELDTLGVHLAAIPESEGGAAATNDVRMFLGYSGWAGGQLEAEMDQGAWLAAPPEATWAFHRETREGLWRAVLRSIGPGAEGLGHLPPDVRWN